jgi:hypothetical protein
MFLCERVLFARAFPLAAFDGWEQVELVPAEALGAPLQQQLQLQLQPQQQPLVGGSQAALSLGATIRNVARHAEVARSLMFDARHDLHTLQVPHGGAVIRALHVAFLCKARARACGAVASVTLPLAPPLPLFGTLSGSARHSADGAATGTGAGAEQRASQ